MQQLDIFAEPPRPVIVDDGIEIFRIALGGKGYLANYVEFALRQNFDGTWSRRTGIQFKWSGMGGPFYGSLPTREAATADCVKGLTTRVKSEWEREANPMAKTALEWLGEFGL